MKSFLFYLCLIFSISSFLIAEDNQPFAHEKFNITPHPKAKFGKLKNGFRYILLHNDNPEKRVLIYLRINAGSLNETDSQQGLAHFLEHMAFNGTKNYPGETMIEFFKKIGMDFGGDTNAYTDFDETVYLLNLPEEKLMKEGLMIMGDYAMNMTLDEKEIENERGVILSEKRERDDIDFRMMFQNFQFVLPNCLIAKRFPIGLEESIKNFPKSEFQSFYDTWYRPENMTLIVVGDITEKKWEKQIEKTFAKFKSRANKMPAPVINDVMHKGIKVNYYYEKEASSTNIEISTVKIEKSSDKDYVSYLKNLLAESAAQSILNKRIAELLMKKETPIISGSFSTELWMKQVHSGTVSATCKPENWAKSLCLLENELRRALVFGFTETELLLFKQEYLSNLDNAIKTESTRQSQDYIGAILSSLSEDQPFMDATQIRDIMKPLLENLKKEEALKAFELYWLYDHRLVTVSGNVIIEDADKEIKKIYEAANKMELEKPIDDKLLKFPTEEKPKVAGKIIKQEEINDIDVTRVAFENNIILNMKKTDYKKDEILIKVNLGNGISGLDESKLGIAHIISHIINEGGLTTLSKTDLMKAITGKTVSVGFSVGQNSFELTGGSNNEDFELALQLLRAYILTPGYRSEAFDVFKKDLDLQYKNLESNINVYFQNFVIAHLTNNYLPSYLPPKAEIDKFTIQDVQTLMTPIFAKGSIEINIVGDIEAEKVISLVSLYFGSLEKREAIVSNKIIDLEIKSPNSKTEEFKTKVSKSLVLIAIPTLDFRNIEEVRQLNILGKILEEKVLKNVREKLSISYSPYAGHEPNQEFKNFCYLQFFADVEPKNIETVLNAFDGIISETLERGITSAELEAVRKPLINHIKDYIKTNEYWLERVMSHSVAEPEQLKWSNSFLKSYEDMTTNQINVIIKKYLKLDKKQTFVLKAVSNDL